MQRSLKAHTYEPNGSRTARELFEETIFTTNQPSIIGKGQTHFEQLIIACHSPMKKTSLGVFWNMSWFADLILYVRRRLTGYDELHSKKFQRPFVFAEKPTEFGSLREVCGQLASNQNIRPHLQTVRLANGSGRTWFIRLACFA
ncbi:hypothetical protein AVEN_173655-1 [Araneus ventricosus]|uniref:Uncharacterized protein n=1 Tax=Araneus ventricosus TaxID=182803 RepID=A0A4Y2DC32_ARAVE|nr:hypothetical protein AVEN_155393-1 [Araneus ventricosus]GBM13444.1 hypothetical protein AVEN_173655-1 [Araneus ventricosus]